VIYLGAIADDFTGGSDLAGMLHTAGASASMVFGLHPTLPSTDAVVVCLKSRSIPAIDARRLSRQAAELLLKHNAKQLYFKYCSTFDSTPAGNIGPVIEELLDLTGAPFTIAVPALPVNGRTQYLGHLFVNGVPLNESPLRHHPLNPMDDANLTRFFARQSNLPTTVVPLNTVRQGANAIRQALASLAPSTVAFIDCASDEDLIAIAAATQNLPFLTGGSGLGLYLPLHWQRTDEHNQPMAKLPNRRALILSGSCSQATLEQLDHLRQANIAVHTLHPNGDFSQAALQANLEHHGLAVLASSAPANQRHGDSSAFEHHFGNIARRAALEWDISQIIVAGGETSGAIVEALQVPSARITSVITPGVPALYATNPKPLGLALKSGNFGQPDFFLQAKQHLDRFSL
jgi:uncharacterized protein YgbK (DUF1537 family)